MFAKKPGPNDETRIERGAERAGNFLHNVRNIIIGAAAIGAAGIAAQQSLFPTEAPATYFYLAGICEGTSRTPDNRWNHPIFVGEQIKIGGNDAPTEPEALRKAIRKRLKGDLLEWPAHSEAPALGLNKARLDGKQLTRIQPGGCVRVDGVKAGKEAVTNESCSGSGRALSIWVTGKSEPC